MKFVSVLTIDYIIFMVTEIFWLFRESDVSFQFISNENYVDSFI